MICGIYLFWTNVIMFLNMNNLHQNKSKLTNTISTLINEEISGTLNMKAIPIKNYLCWNRNSKIRLSSSSGGLFSVIASYILKKNGVIFGAAYDINMNVVHIYVDNEKNLSRLRGSKYVKSNLGNSFVDVKNFLNAGRFVYFVGTPCQVAGLKNYLKLDYDNLITSDLICHGTPSNNLFQFQIKELELKYKARIIDFNFRSKVRFGQGYDLEIKFENNKKEFVKYLNAELLPYFYGFWENITLREGCYQCKYATVNRISDITLGDYWLAKEEHPTIKISEGLSLLMINSQKGLKVFDSIKSNINYIESSLEAAIKGQGQLKAPVKRPKIRDKYLEEVKDLDFKTLSKRYLTPVFSKRVKYKVRNIVKTMICFKYWK